MTDDLARAIAQHAVARSLLPWEQKEHDDLDPQGETVFEVIDHWLACRATIFDVGLGQMRYGLTDREVEHLAEHVEKWLDSRP